MNERLAARGEKSTAGERRCRWEKERCPACSIGGASRAQRDHLFPIIPPASFFERWVAKEVCKRKTKDQKEKKFAGVMLGVGSSDRRENLARGAGHCPFGLRSERSRMITRSPGVRFSWGLVHLMRCWRVFRYSRLHRAQKWSRILRTRLQWVQGSRSESAADGPRIVVRSVPTRKWAGVRASRSSQSPDSGLSGRTTVEDHPDLHQ